MIVPTVLIFRHDRVTQCKESKEHVDMGLSGLHRLPEPLIVEAEIRLVHRVVGKVNPWGLLSVNE